MIHSFFLDPTGVYVVVFNMAWMLPLCGDRYRDRTVPRHQPALTGCQRRHLAQTGTNECWRRRARAASRQQPTPAVFGDDGCVLEHHRRGYCIAALARRFDERCRAAMMLRSYVTALYYMKTPAVASQVSGYPLSSVPTRARAPFSRRLATSTPSPPTPTSRAPASNSVTSTAAAL